MAKVGIMLKNLEFDNLLKDKGLTIYKLANITGIAPSTIYRALDSDNLSFIGGETIVKISKALGLTEAEFDKLFIFSQAVV